jgi:hypothetical protein
VGSACIVRVASAAACHPVGMEIEDVHEGPLGGVARLDLRNVKITGSIFDRAAVERAECAQRLIELIARETDGWRMRPLTVRAHTGATYYLGSEGKGHTVFARGGVRIDMWGQPLFGRQRRTRHDNAVVQFLAEADEVYRAFRAL